MDQDIYQLAKDDTQLAQALAGAVRAVGAQEGSILLMTPSGRMHIAQGVFKAMNVNKCTAAGGTFIFWVADWFALMNDKMGGDLERIKTVGLYLIHVWRAAGMDMGRVKFLWSSEEITKHAPTYWTQALDIARRFKNVHHSLRH